MICDVWCVVCVYCFVVVGWCGCDFDCCFG